MPANPAEDWRALTEHYRSMSDEHLLELADAFNDLTPTAQQVLRDELKLRNLGDPGAPGWGFAARQSAPSPEALEGSAVEFTWKTPLCDCDTPQEAWQIAEVLRRAAIESWIEGPNSYARSSGSEHPGFDVGNRRVLVAADQLEEANRILERPIPADVIELSHMAPPEYEVPVCPVCGAADPILESVDPVNAWSCESCGAEWADEAAQDQEP